MTNRPDTPEVILIPVRIDALAYWLTNDTEKYDEHHQPDDGWTIEPTADDIVETASTLIDDYAADQYRHDDDELLVRIASLLTAIATQQRQGEVAQ